MPRYFADRGQIGERQIELTGPDVNHIKNVLRMSPGDDVTVSDGDGTDFFCHIASLEKDRVMLDIVDSWPSFVELPVRLWLFQGLPKADKMDLIVQKTVELGIYRIVPVIMKRTVVNLDEKKKAKKTERWRSISRSAAMQAGRGLIPQVDSPVSFDRALEMCRDLDRVVMPYEKAAGMDSARELVHSMQGQKSIGIFIGPEGGFDPGEVERAIEAGAQTMSLGHRILRTETAGMAVMSILMFELEKDQE